jgi:hypothetical protein
MPRKKLDQDLMEELKAHTYKWYQFGCKDATYLETKAKFSNLSLSEKMLFSFHLFTCKYCRRFVAQVKKIEHLIGLSVNSTEVKMGDKRKETINQLITEKLTKN